MEEVIETTQQTTEEVNTFIQYIQDHIPNLIGFGVKVLFALLFFAIGKIFIKWIRGFVRKALERSTVDKGVEQFVDSLLKFGLYGVLIFSIATKFGFDTASVAALIASAGVAIGLAVQGTLSNFAGGVLILILKPFVVGDYIIENNQGNEGTVNEIQMFYTKLATVDNKIVIVPNSMLTSGSLVNITQMKKRNLIIEVGISYDADIRQAKDILMDLMMKEECIDHEMEMKTYVSELGADGVILGMRGWVNTDDYWNARWDMLEQIKYAFDDAGIEIPYHKMDINIKKDLQNFENQI